MSIKDVIENDEFYHVFQPVFETDAMRKVGYEVLFRTRLFSTPEEVFITARNEKQLYEIDSRSIQKAVQTYFSADSKMQGYLFVNIFPSTILHDNFPHFLRLIITENNIVRQSDSPFTNNIVFEILESESIPESQVEVFIERVKIIKESGFLIAVDDLGKGSDSFQFLIELQPNFLKLSGYFSNKLFHSKQKQHIVSLLKNYCDQHNCILVLEGIEHELDLSIAKSLGIPFAQGYLLGRPGLLQNHYKFNSLFT